jgi:hypothetical protein
MRRIDMPRLRPLILVGLLSMSFLLTPVFSITAYPDDGPLDVYGCHYGRKHHDYHCHEGVFKLGSFDSKTQMVRLLRLQFLNLGRPWPYGQIQPEEIKFSRPETEQRPKFINSSRQPQPAAEHAKNTMQLMKHKDLKTKQQTLGSAAKPTIQRFEHSKPKPSPRSRQPERGDQQQRIQSMDDWLVKITSDGTAIYENSRHERFRFDENGNRVYFTQAP